MGPPAAPAAGHVQPFDAGPGPAPDGEPYAAVVETHTSVVLFLGDRAYKWKKPVRLPFIDLSTPEARLENCRREVRLNRRLAPDVYLGVYTLTPEDQPGAPGEPVVVMRRMPAARRLSALIDLGDTEAATRCVRSVARQVAVLHAAEHPVPGFALATTMRCLWQEGRDQVEPFLGTLLPRDGCDEVLARALEYLAGRGRLLEDRERAGLVTQGHGDLLADDIFELDDGARILDCLEFDDRLRAGDVLADVAFLAMDLQVRGASGPARLLLDTFHGFLPDHHPRSLENHYLAYRAFVRAKVECLRHSQGEPAAAGRARRFLDLCRCRLDDARLHLIVLGGLPGTGKSTVAGALAEQDADRDWAVISSDELRKQLAGVAPQTSRAAAFGTGLYDAAHTGAMYRELLRRAATTLAAGVGVILDASWTDAGLRQHARDVAAAHHAEVIEIRCVAPDLVCRERLRLRRPGEPGQASDAGPAIHRALALRQDPWPQARPLATDGAVGAAVEAVLMMLRAD